MNFIIFVLMSDSHLFDLENIPTSSIP